MNLPRINLPGTDRHELRPHTLEARCHPDERHEISVLTAPHITDNEADLLRGFATDHGLVVVSHERPRRRMVMSGRTPNLESAFGVELIHREGDHGSHCCHYGPVSIPTVLEKLVEGVFGLDQRSVAKPHFRKPPARFAMHAATRAHNAVIERLNPDLNTPSHPDVIAEACAAYEAQLKQPAGTFTPVQVASLYDFPDGDGSGECIAIIELGGGYSVKDLKAYFAEIGVPLPNVSSVSVDHGKNQTGSDADGEVMLDIEVAGAIAPAAKIVVYFCPNTDQGFIDGISAAIHDSVNKPSVISISWGGPESSWTHAAMTSMDKLFQEAGTLGITVLVAAGDNGSSDGLTGNHVDFPASSPNVLACGGTKLVANGNTIVSEVVWNEDASGEGAGGGGYSAFFAEPSYQSPRRGHWRGVPDVAGDSDPESGYFVRVDGQDTTIGGTSAVAPLYAGLVARLNQIRGKSCGALNSVLYANPHVCRDITSGNNGSFHATAGYDVCTGLGVIDGAKLLSALEA